MDHNRERKQKQKMTALFLIMGITLFVGATLAIFKIGEKEEICKFDDSVKNISEEKTNR